MPNLKNDRYLIPVGKIDIEGIQVKDLLRDKYDMGFKMTITSFLSWLAADSSRINAANINN